MQHMVLTALSMLVIVLHIALPVALVRKYWLTRDVGFVWLGVAVVIWPLVSQVLRYGGRVFVDRLGKGEPVGFYPFSLVERGQMSLGDLVIWLSLFGQLIGVSLLLVAVHYLCKPKSNG
jgi:hypothetical protein